MTFVKSAWQLKFLGDSSHTRDTFSKQDQTLAFVQSVQAVLLYNKIHVDSLQNEVTRNQRETFCRDI